MHVHLKLLQQQLAGPISLERLHLGAKAQRRNGQSAAGKELFKSWHFAHKKRNSGGHIGNLACVLDGLHMDLAYARLKDGDYWTS